MSEGPVEDDPSRSRRWELLPSSRNGGKTTALKNKNEQRWEQF